MFQVWWKEKKKSMIFLAEKSPPFPLFFFFLTDVSSQSYPNLKAQVAVNLILLWRER